MSKQLPQLSQLSLLRMLLAEPAEEIRSLPAPLLLEVVSEVGLEDAGDLLALASREQLEALLDEDSWSPDGESIDPGRFSLWLQVLLESQPDRSRLHELDDDFIAYGLAQLVVVLDLDQLAPRISSRSARAGEAFEKALESAPSLEIEPYRIVFRREEVTEALTSFLLWMDQEDSSRLQNLLERLASFGEDLAEEHGGWTELLSSLESAAAEQSQARDQRRAALGFVSPTDAKAFLAQSPESLIKKSGLDPVSHAFFRDYVPQLAPKYSPLASSLKEIVGNRDKMKALPDPAGRYREMVKLLKAEGCARAWEEIAFLANVLLADASSRQESLRRADAVAEVLAVLDEYFKGKDSVALWKAHGLPPLFLAARVMQKIRTKP
jgi:Family of unknown function (DUF6178)